MARWAGVARLITSTTVTSGPARAEASRPYPPQERPTGAAWSGLRSLRVKLVIAGGVWVAIVIGVVTAIGLGIAERRLEEDLRETARLTAVAVADDLELRPEPVNAPAVTATLRDFLAAGPSVRDITLFTVEDGIPRVAIATSPATAMPDSLVQRAIDGMRTVSEDRGEQLTAVATPVLREGRLEGAVLVTVALTPVVRLRNEGRLLATVIAVIAILGITALIHLLLAGLERQHTLMREELWRVRELATVGQTMANVAHQVGTPLNLVSAHVQLLQQELPTDLSAQRRLGIISEQVDRVTTSVKDLLDRLRPNAAARLIALKPLLERLVESGQVLAAAQHARVVLEAPDDLPFVLGDETQFELGLANLVTNGLDAMPGGGLVLVAAAPAPGGVVITVSDGGAGIPPHLIERIFEPWITTKPAGRGTGLGLSIARDVIQQMGGTITAQSRAGGGTIVRVTVPSADTGGL
jgi:signal transduction histidine kinase